LNWNFDMTFEHVQPAVTHNTGNSALAAPSGTSSAGGAIVHQPAPGQHAPSPVPGLVAADVKPFGLAAQALAMQPPAHPTIADMLGMRPLPKTTRGRINRIDPPRKTGPHVSLMDRVLRELEDGPGTLSEIVEGAGGHRSTVRRVLERAVADGLVNAAGRRESLNGRTAVIFALAGDDR